MPIATHFPLSTTTTASADNLIVVFIAVSLVAASVLDRRELPMEAEFTVERKRPEYVTEGFMEVTAEGKEIDEEDEEKIWELGGEDKVVIEGVEEVVDGGDETIEVTIEGKRAIEGVKEVVGGRDGTVEVREEGKVAIEGVTDLKEFVMEVVDAGGVEIEEGVTGETGEGSVKGTGMWGEGGHLRV